MQHPTRPFSTTEGGCFASGCNPVRKECAIIHSCTCRQDRVGRTHSGERTHQLQKNEWTDVHMRCKWSQATNFNNALSPRTCKIRPSVQLTVRADSSTKHEFLHKAVKTETAAAAGLIKRMRARQHAAARTRRKNELTVASKQLAMQCSSDRDDGKM